MKILVLSLLFTSVVFASDIDYRVLDIAKNYNYGAKEVNQDDFFKFDPVDLSSQFGIGAQCGQLSFDANIVAAVNKIKSQLTNKQLIVSLAKASPLLAACHFDPALCAAIQNVEQTVNFLMKFGIDQCAIIDKYTSSKAASYNQRIADCIGAEKAKGADEHKAHEFCIKTMTDKLASITGNGGFVKTINVLEDSMQWMGLSDSQVKADAKKLVGETTINHGVIKDIFGENGEINTPFHMQQAFQKEIKTKFCQKLDKNQHIESNGIISFTKSIKLDNLLRGHFTDSTIQNLYVLPEPARNVLCLEMASYIAREVVISKTKTVFDVLSQSLTNPNLTEMTLEILELKVRKLESFIKIQNMTKAQTSEMISAQINNEATLLMNSIKSQERDGLHGRKLINSKKEEIITPCSAKVRC